MPDLSEDFIKELIAGKDKEPSWLKGLTDRIGSLEEKIAGQTKSPENPVLGTPAQPQIISATPALPTPAIPGNPNAPIQYTFQRRGRGLKLVQPKESKENKQPASTLENKEQNSSSTKTA